MDSIRKMKKTLYAYCRALDLPPDMYPHIESYCPCPDGVYFTNRPQYSFCVIERGKAISRTVCETAFDVYYGILKIYTFELAIRTEARQRKPNEDPRRQIFSIQHDLLKSIDEAFASKFSTDIEALLRKYPYDDKPFTSAEPDQ